MAAVFLWKRTQFIIYNHVIFNFAITPFFLFWKTGIYQIILIFEEIILVLKKLDVKSFFQRGHFPIFWLLWFWLDQILFWWVVKHFIHERIFISDHSLLWLYPQLPMYVGYGHVCTCVIYMNNCLITNHFTYPCKIKRFVSNVC